MKNIHLLPTEKPSSLYYKDDNYKSANSTMAIDWYISSAGYNPTNIYITSDEEISGLDNNIWVILGTRVFLWQNMMALVSNNKPRKIILTTDQDLIADGVQSIDDEFLEWFVKNPSCEMAHVVYDRDIITEGLQTLKYFSVTLKFGGYRIIIPQEEPKQDPTLENSKLALREYILANKEKVTEDLQEMREKSGTGRDETLEEADENKKNLYYYKQVMNPYSVEEYSYTAYEKGFIEGYQESTKWQQERMYSEEDMKQFAFECVANFLSNNDNKVEIKLVDVIIDRLNNQFEQFKKK
jgi:hypothetical protein